MPANTPTQPQHDDTKPIRVFVQLAHGQDIHHWNRLREAGKLVGINDPMPYGYHRANDMGCDVEYSIRRRDGRIYNFFRLGVRAILGFDYLYARQNAKQALKSDVIWTHTEAQFLAVALIFALRGKNKPRPKLLGQAVWLYDKWPKIDPVRKFFYRRLLKYVDRLTVHSPLNQKVAADLFPDKQVDFVKYGIPHEDLQTPKLRQNTPHYILCVGNDRHRDWETVIKAFANTPGVCVRILSTKTNPDIAKHAENIEIRGVHSNEEMQAERDKASVMIIPLKENLHVSGSTTLQEAALFGIPIIATRTGGLEAYLGDDAVSYVPPNDPEALKEATMNLLNDPHAALERAKAAQVPILSGEWCADAYVKQHVDISRELLGLPAKT